MKEFPVAFGPKKTPGSIENTSRGFDPRATERYHPQIRSWRGSTYEEGCFVCGALDYWQRDCLQARQSKAKQGPRTLWEWRSYQQDAYKGGRYGQCRATVETGPMGTETTTVVVMDPTATQEGMPSASDLHHLLLELPRLLSRRLTVPQSQWRLALLRASSVKRRSRRLMERCTQNTRFLMAILNGTTGERA